jgi:RHS repeat-associated protein
MAGAPSAPLKEYVYRGGQLLVAFGCDTMRWLVADHLGTPRIEVDLTGSLSGVKRHDYLPFGEELMAGTGVRSASHGYPTFAGSDCIRQQFRSKERDNETGLDYSNARYYSSFLGRFTSVDDENVGANILDPQTLNAYVFARNSPVVFSDPQGRRHLVCGPSKGGSCGFIDDDAFQRYRRALRPVGLASTGNEDSLQSGNILVQGSYELISIDDSVKRFVFENTGAIRADAFYFTNPPQWGNPQASRNNNGFGEIGTMSGERIFRRGLRLGF